MNLSNVALTSMAKKSININSGVSSVLLRSNSEVPTSEFSCRQCDDSSIEQFDTALGLVSQRILLTHKFYYPIFKLQWNTGCRAVEMWDKERWQRNKDGIISMTPCKKSEQRTFSADDSTIIAQWFEEALNLAKNGFTYDNYRRVVRGAMAHFNIYMIDERGHRYGSTHILRHVFAKSLINQGYSIEEAQIYMGEKTLKAFKSYLGSIIHIN